MKTLFLSLLIVSSAQAAWGNGICYPSPAVAGFPRFLHPVIVHPPVANCPCSERCVCGCNEGKVCECNGPAVKVEAAEPLFGVVDEKREGKDGYKLTGKPVSRYQALAAIEKDLPDDKLKLRLTFIGSPADTKRAKDRLKGSDIESSLIVQAYTPDNWAVKDVGFQLVGSPVVYLQSSDGKVLHKQDNDEGMVEALRKRILPLSPLSPNAPPGGKPLLDQLKALPLWIWLVAGGMLLLLLNKKKDESK